jgi:hypothetical protein
MMAVKKDDDPFRDIDAKQDDDPFSGNEVDAEKTPKKTPNQVQLLPRKPIVLTKPLHSGRAAIEKALEQPTVLQFNDTPLGDVVDYLRKSHQIEIYLDEKPLMDASITRETPITEEIRGVPLKSALRLMLKKIGAAYTIQNDVLFITTPEEVDDNLRTKLYDVADLVVCRDDHDNLWDDFDTLIDVLETAIKPNYWTCNGDNQTISPVSLGTAKFLAISERDESHEVIADLLESIREVGRKHPAAGLPRRNPTPPEPIVVEKKPTAKQPETPVKEEKKEVKKDCKKDEKKPDGATNPRPTPHDIDGQGMF